jgi:hypothetical protein
VPEPHQRADKILRVAKALGLEGKGWQDDAPDWAKEDEPDWAPTKEPDPFPEDLFFLFLSLNKNLDLSTEGVKVALQALKDGWKAGIRDFSELSRMALAALGVGKADAEVKTEEVVRDFETFREAAEGGDEEEEEEETWPEPERVYITQPIYLPAPAQKQLPARPPSRWRRAAPFLAGVAGGLVVAYVTWRIYQKLQADAAAEEDE